jgi:hypothetical protein
MDSPQQARVRVVEGAEIMRLDALSQQSLKIRPAAEIPNMYVRAQVQDAT